MNCYSRIQADRANQFPVISCRKNKKIFLPIKAFHSPSSSVKDFGFICFLVITITGFFILQIFVI